MRNRNLIFSLVASSLFIPSVEALESTNDFDSLENENNNGINILIAEGGGGGGGMSAKKRNEKKLKDAVDSYEYFWNKREEAIEKGESTTKIDEKIKKYVKRIKKLDIYEVSPIIIDEIMGGGPNSRGPIGEGEGVDTQEAEIEDPIMGGGPNSRGPKIKENQKPTEGVNIPIGEGEGVVIPIGEGSGASGKSTKDKKIISDYKEAIEYNKTDNKLGNGVALRELRKKVLNLKKKINKMQAPKDADIFEFIDNKYASIKILDLMESHIILLMSELKKIDDVTKNRQLDKYNPNINEVEKQQKVLAGLDIVSDKYLSSLTNDFNLLKINYSESTLQKMKITNGTDNQNDDNSFIEGWRRFTERENER